MPKYRPLITSMAWRWHLNLEKAVEQGLMRKEPDDFTLSGFRYVPIVKEEWDDAEDNETQ